MTNVVTLTFRQTPRHDPQPPPVGIAEIITLPQPKRALNIEKGFRLRVSELKGLAAVADAILAEQANEITSKAEAFLMQTATQAREGTVIFSIKQAHWLLILAEKTDYRWYEGESFLEAYSAHREAKK